LIFFMACVNKYQHRQSSGPVNLWCVTSLAVLSNLSCVFLRYDIFSF
jgi:hypothetical protein